MAQKESKKMTSEQKVKNVQKYIKERRENNELYLRLLEFEKHLRIFQQQYRTKIEEMNNLDEIKHHLQNVLSRLNLKEEFEDAQTIQRKIQEYRRQKYDILTEIVSITEKIKENENLIHLYEVDEDKKLMQIWELEKAIGIRNISYPDWKNAMDMEHHKKTGIIKDKTQ